MRTLTFKEIISLGLFNFALYVGAGNIILPPYIGFMAGDGVWIAAIGFLLTGVGLPVVTAVAMARLKGSLGQLTMPLGKVIGMGVIIVCYLYTGSLVAIPRVAAVSYDLGIRPFFDTKTLEIICYCIFFAFVTLVAFSPGRFFEVVGKVLTPIKVGVLVFLCATVFFVMSPSEYIAQDPYASEPMTQGLVQGYLTMDMFGSLVFSLLLVNAVQARGVTDEKLTIRYVIYCGTIAGIGLALIYLCLFRLGQVSTHIAAGADNGAKVLSSYIVDLFGFYGQAIVSVVIIVACLVTAIGLTASIATFCNELFKVPYYILVIGSGVIALFVANLGLTQLLHYSVAALQAVYPVFILLIAMSFFHAYMKNPIRVTLPAAVIAFAFGLMDAFKTLDVFPGFYNFAQHFPLANLGLAWVVPCFVLAFVTFMFDKMTQKPVEA